MDCITTFLREAYQHRLRLFAQVRSERYEKSIEEYKKIFIAHLQLIKNGCTNKCYKSNECNIILNTINSIEIKEVERFFDTLKEVYLLWIDAKSIDAINKFTTLLQENELLKFEKKIKDYDLFFKGRETQQVLTAWDMFHIPFNKRYLIKNQRYSLTGQPMLYIGSSVIDIVKEIEAQSSEQLQLSVITISDNNLRIYDLKNNIDDKILDMVFSDLVEKEEKYERADFFKMILSSVCSFRKRQELKGFSFCEEYVLPQLLAQILKVQGFDGISYYSTKRYEFVKYKNDSEEYGSEETDSKEQGSEEYDEQYNIEFKENIALFTNINEEHVYDRELYDKLKISTPTNVKSIETISFEDIEELAEEIKQSKEQEKVTCAEMIVSSFRRNYSKMYIDNELYVETDYGKLHIYQVYVVLNEILVA